MDELKIPNCSNLHDKKCNSCHDALEIDNWTSADDNLNRLDDRENSLTSCLFNRQLVGDAQSILNDREKDKKPAESFTTSCHYQLDLILDHVESTLSEKSNSCQSTQQHLIGTLDQVISFCGNFPLEVWKDSLIGADRTRRLFRACLYLKAKKSGIALLDLLGTNFFLDVEGKLLGRGLLSVEDIQDFSSFHEEFTSQVDSSYDEEVDEFEDDSGSDESEEEISCAFCHLPTKNHFMISCDECYLWYHGKCVGVTRAMGQELYERNLDWVCSECVYQQKSKNLDSMPRLFYEGIGNDKVAEAIGEFVCLLGWKDCSDSILRLVSPTRIPEQLAGIISLIGQLLVGRCWEGAIRMANRLAEILAQFDENETSFTQDHVKAYVDLMITLEINPTTADYVRMSLFIEFFAKLKPFHQFHGPSSNVVLETILSSQVMWEQAAILSMIAKSGNGRTVLINSVNDRIAQLKKREQTEDNFLDDLQSCIRFLSCVVDIIQPPANSMELDSLLEIYSKLSNEHLCHVICGLLELFQRRPPTNELTSHPLVNLCQVLLKRDKLFTSEQGITLVIRAAQLLLNQNEFFYQTLIEFVVGTNFTTLYKKILAEVDFWNHPNPTWTFSLLMTAWICLIWRNHHQKDECYSEMLDLFCTVIHTENLLAELDFNLDSIVNYFFCLFDDMSTVRLGQLIADVYNFHCASQTTFKTVPVSLKLYECICQTFIERDLKLLMNPIHELLLPVTQAILWLDDESLLTPFCNKINPASSFHLDNPAVREILNCEEIKNLVLASDKSSCIWNAFGFLLDQRITYLKSIDQPVFSWIQPDAVMEEHPLVEEFLRSPRKRMMYRIFNRDVQTAELFADRMKKKDCFVHIISQQDHFIFEIRKTRLHQQVDRKHSSHAKAELAELITLRKSIERNDLLAMEKEVPEQMNSMINTNTTKKTAENSLFEIRTQPSVLDLIDLENSKSFEQTKSSVYDLDENIEKLVQKHLENEGENPLHLLSPLVEKLSIWRLFHLLTSLFQSNPYKDSVCFKFCRFIAQQLISRDLCDLLKSTSDIVVETMVDVMVSLLWIGDDQSLSNFTNKICSLFSPWQENIFVSKMVANSEARKMAATCQVSRKCFCILLDQRINRLKIIKAERSCGNDEPCSNDVSKELEEMKALQSSLEELCEVEECRESATAKSSVKKRSSVDYERCGKRVTK